MRFIHNFLWLPLSDVGAWRRLTLQNAPGNFSTFFTHFLNTPSARTKNERIKIFEDIIQEIFLKMKSFIFTSKRQNMFRNKFFKWIAIEK